MQNTFANECFLDELAVEAKADPIAFRKKHLDDARGIECIDRVAALSKWKSGASHSSPKRQGDIVYGRGVSYIKYELVRTYVAVVADVQVNLKTGKVKVDQFYVAHDCGQIINQMAYAIRLMAILFKQSVEP